MLPERGDAACENDSPEEGRPAGGGPGDVLVVEKKRSTLSLPKKRGLARKSLYKTSVWNVFSFIFLARQDARTFAPCPAAVSEDQAGNMKRKHATGPAGERADWPVQALGMLGKSMRCQENCPRPLYSFKRRTIFFASENEQNMQSFMQ